MSRHVSVTASAFLGRLPGQGGLSYSPNTQFTWRRVVGNARSLPTFFSNRAGRGGGRKGVIRPDPPPPRVTSPQNSTSAFRLLQGGYARRILRIFHAGHAFDSKGWTTGLAIFGRLRAAPLDNRAALRYRDTRYARGCRFFSFFESKLGIANENRWYFHCAVINPLRLNWRGDYIYLCSTFFKYR